MKKFVTVILALVLGLCSFIPAFADIEGPAYAEFDVIVINSDGAKFYDEEYNIEIKNYELFATEIILPNDSIVTAKGEFEFEGTDYFSVDYNDNHGYIKADDVTIVNDVFTIENSYKFDQPQQFIVIDEGVFMHKGPSEHFETVGEEIEVGTVFTYQYVNSYSNGPWAYVTYKGVSGWVYFFQYGYTYKCAIPFDAKSIYSRDLYVVDDGVRLTDIPDSPEFDVSEAEYITDDIPVGTKLEFDDYYYDQVKTLYVYTEYNGVKGWVGTDSYHNVGAENNTAIGKTGIYYVWQKDGLDVYSKPGDKSSEIISKLEYGQLIETKYVAENYIETDNGLEHYSWYGVEINGQLGWFITEYSSEDEGCFDYFRIVKNKTVNNEVNVYKEQSKDSEVLATVPANQEVIRLGSAYDYILVDYNGIIGFVDNNDLIELEWDEEEMNTLTPAEYFGKVSDETTTEIYDIAVPESSSEAVTETESNGSKYTPTEFTAICVIGAVAVALTALVVIILINKKKKN